LSLEHSASQHIVPRPRTDVGQATRKVAMGIGEKISANLQEARLFGPRILLRHLARRLGVARMLLRLQSGDRIQFRPGDSDFAVIRQIFVSREYDFSLRPAVAGHASQAYRAILAAGQVPVIVDAGANTGISTLWFRHAFPEATIVPVEPERTSFELLCENCAPHARILPVHAAIGCRPGFVGVSTAGESWTATTQRSAAGVPVITVADAFEKVERGRPFIVKIDIEGFERDLFSQNLGWLDETPVVVVEPHDWMFTGCRTSGPLQAAMGSRNFELVIMGENLVYLRVG
jgi:FkbM family methyltransferase